MNFDYKLHNAKLLIFFGLGVQFHDTYYQLLLALGKEPDFLFDNSTDKWGKEFFGRKCITVTELSELDKSAVFVITVRKYEQIYNQLAEMGFKNIFVAVFDRTYDIVGNIKKLDLNYVQNNNVKSISVKENWTFITGASRGIGAEIARNMAKLGSNLILHSRKIENTKKIEDECLAYGVQVKSIEAELSNLEELDQMLERLINDFPPVDIVFNNAAVSLPCGADPWKISSRDYLTHYTINTVAPIQICNRLTPLMIKRGFGRIINITSTIQKRMGEAAYACSKAALNKFVFDITPSLQNTGVMISLVCPGYVRSDMGGINAPHDVTSVIPGVLLGAVMDSNVNGRWFIAQDYAGLTLDDAMMKDEFYYSREDKGNV